MTKSSKKGWRATPTAKAHARELRRTMTPAERELWRLLRGGQLEGAHFRKQHPVGRYVVDFYCARAKLAVEIDGETHDEQEEHDAERTRWLQDEQGCRVIRFTNRDVHSNAEGVVAAIAEALKAQQALKH